MAILRGIVFLIGIVVFIAISSAIGSSLVSSLYFLLTPGAGCMVFLIAIGVMILVGKGLDYLIFSPAGRVISNFFNPWMWMIAFIIFMIGLSIFGKISDKNNKNKW